jgi:uncharacterized membrane protein
MIILGFIFGSWGIRKNLPYFEEADESLFVARAVRMAANGDLNPHWFGHPGSTTFYPLMLIYHTWFAATENGHLFTANNDLQNHFDQEKTDYFLLARFLSILYGVLSLPVTYLLGKNVFSSRIGLIGAWLLLSNSVYWYYSQIVRTDTAALFWGALSLLLCFTAYKSQRWRNYIFAGLVIGISISSRYFMVALIPVLFLIWLATYLQNREDQTRRQLLFKGAAALISVIAGFAITTPYFFLDSTTAMANLLLEARSEHLGADGLTPWGNFWWYLTVAIPSNITWWQMLLTLVGMAIAVARKRWMPVLLIIYVMIFLVLISLSSLHWMRWVAQLLPVFALFTALALDVMVSYWARRLDWRARTHQFVLVLCVVIISIWPLYQTVLHNIRQSNPSTRVLARQWMVENLPANSKIGQENYTAALAGTDFEVVIVDPLSTEGSLSNYTSLGFDYLVASSSIYGRYLAEPERYADQVSFYESLFSEAQLMQRIDPSSTRTGPIIQIFKLPD